MMRSSGALLAQDRGAVRPQRLPHWNIGLPIAGVVSGLQAVVDRLAQRLAGFEVRHQLLRDGDLLAAARIAPQAWRAAGDRETAETADLDAMPAGERIAHRIEAQTT